MKLTKTTEKFIVHWGEMGAKWGINRSVAQIHALLMVSPGPLPADEIAESLGIARSNVSMGIRELESWGLVRVVHKLGDRRDHFATLDDVWEMLLIILRERRKRELDPTVGVIRECLKSLSSDKEIDDAAELRLRDLAEMLEQASRWCDRSQALTPAGIRRLVNVGDKVFKLVS